MFKFSWLSLFMFFLPLFAPAIGFGSQKLHLAYVRYRLEKRRNALVKKCNDKSLSVSKRQEYFYELLIDDTPHHYPVFLTQVDTGELITEKFAKKLALFSSSASKHTRPPRFTTTTAKGFFPPYELKDYKQIKALPDNKPVIEFIQILLDLNQIASTTFEKTLIRKMMELYYENISNPLYLWINENWVEAWGPSRPELQKLKQAIT